MYSPIGSAIAVAAATETAQMARCSSSRNGIPVSPGQLAGSVSQAMTSSISG